MEASEVVIPIASSSNGRASAKSWKPIQKPTVRTLQSIGRKAKSFEERMGKAQKAHAIKKIETELKEEKQADITKRKETIVQRRKAAEERKRIEEEKAKMGAKKAARLRRRLGRTKKVNG